MCCYGRFRGLRQAKSDEAQEHDDDERTSVVGLSPITLLIHCSPHIRSTLKSSVYRCVLIPASDALF
jgi:hypothetical protein